MVQKAEDHVTSPGSLSVVIDRFVAIEYGQSMEPALQITLTLFI